MYHHTWFQESTCLNGPHVWRCSVCRETTRSYAPRHDADCIDPDDGHRYLPDLNCPCRMYGPPSYPGWSDDNRERIAIVDNLTRRGLTIMQIARMYGVSTMWLGSLYYGKRK